eukprot:4938030-Amphidinium_carterae.2
MDGPPPGLPMPSLCHAQTHAPIPPPPAQTPLPIQPQNQTTPAPVDQQQNTVLQMLANARVEPAVDPQRAVGCQQNTVLQLLTSAATSPLPPVPPLTNGATGPPPSSSIPSVAHLLGMSGLSKEQLIQQMVPPIPSSASEASDEDMAA